MEGSTTSLTGSLTSNGLLHAADDRKRFKFMVAKTRN